MTGSHHAPTVTAPRAAAYRVPRQRTHRAPARAFDTTFGGPAVAPDDGPDYAAIHASAEFVDVRSRLRRFVLVATVAFFAWYMLFVLLSAFAPGLMAVPVVGAVNVGMLLGLSQFATTLAIIAAYRHYARTRIDPRVRALRQRYATHESAGRHRSREV